jgi:hypothetical protein
MDIQKMINWIKINVVEKGLVPANPITALALVREFPNELEGDSNEERLYYAKQIVIMAKKQLY